MDSQIYYLGVAEMSKLIASRQLSPVELLETFLHRIETIDKDINSYLLVTRDEALKQARYMEAELSAGRTRGHARHSLCPQGRLCDGRNSDNGKFKAF
jgi:aspartyl-tRNA(Asn)/glutamyl-tRNA(Gln) amidotransferase subunit A